MEGGWGFISRQDKTRALATLIPARCSMSSWPWSGRRQCAFNMALSPIGLSEAMWLSSSGRMECGK